MAKRPSKKPIKIKKSEEGSLTAIARREGGMSKGGKGISAAWMRKKMNDPKTSAAVKKKLNFAMNARKWK